jgi:hypothetical protein
MEKTWLSYRQTDDYQMRTTHRTSVGRLHCKGGQKPTIPVPNLNPIRSGCYPETCLEHLGQASEKLLSELVVDFGKAPQVSGFIEFEIV